MFWIIFNLIFNISIFIPTGILLKSDTIAGSDTLVISVFIVAFLSWVFVLGLVYDEVYNQHKRINEYLNLSDKKASYERQLAGFTTEVRSFVMESFSDLEKAIFGNIKDSKLLAAHLEKGDYSDIVVSYINRISDMQYNIHKCDREALDLLAKIKTAQENRLAWALFIPKFDHKGQ